MSERLPSERIVVSAPLSFSGSARRLWAPVRRTSGPVAVALGVAMVLAIIVAWTAVIGWYLLFGVLMWPYQLVRRGQRKERRDAARHRELLAALERQQRPGG